MTHRFAFVLLILSFACLACENEPEPSAAQNRAGGIEALAGVELSVSGSKVIFDGSATEVMLSVTNRRDQPVGLSGLTGKAKLILESGQELPIHEISLGVAKPLVVPANEVVTTSLLFSGAATGAVNLRLLEAEVPIPR